MQQTTPQQSLARAGRNIAFMRRLLLATALLAPLAGCIGGNLNRTTGPDGQTKTTYGKVVICHKGETLEVGRSALAPHMQHGDRRGKCIGG